MIGDFSEPTRYGYGDKEEYTLTARRSRQLYHKFEQEWGVKLLYGGVRLASNAGEKAKKQKEIFDRLKLPYQIMSHDELRRNFPLVGFDDIESAFVETDAAMIMAHQTIMKAADVFSRKGGKIVIGKAKLGGHSGKQDVLLESGERLNSDAFVFTCGPWLRYIFPGILGKKLWNVRCDVVYFGPPAGDDRFSWPNFPQINLGMSTYPSFSNGVKVIPIGGGNIDLDNEERVVASEQIKRAREHLVRRVPLLRNAPVVASRVCQFEMAGGGDFLIDHHPEMKNIWFAGGGSAHGFKHGPFLGEYISARVLGQKTDPRFDKIFSLENHWSSSK